MGIRNNFRNSKNRRNSSEGGEPTFSTPTIFDKKQKQKQTKFLKNYGKNDSRRV